MSFITIGDTLINFDYVKELHHDKDGVTLIYADGTDDHFKGYWRADYRQLLAPVVAAAPGFFELQFWYQLDEEPSAAAVLNFPNLREPIVAWRIGQYGPEPVTIEEAPAYDQGMSAILYPDGSVVAPLSYCLENIEAWADYVCGRWVEWRENKKADGKRRAS
jgi:hypothetical protein